MGDSAATIDLGNTINELLNDKVLAMQQWITNHSFAGQKDVIVAYSSLSVIYDPLIIKRQYHPSSSIFEWVKEKMEEAYDQSVIQPPNLSTVIRIPVCYEDEYAPDLNTMAAEKQMTTAEIIELHIGKTYRVYTIGFLPGFSYMAEVDEKLVIPRKSQPVLVAAGSVGIAGAQTGIYPLTSPGGWHIIGRTPVKQFDKDSKELIKLNAGNHVQFFRISKEEMLSM